MDTPTTPGALAPAIARLVQHLGGPTETSRKLGGTPVYQEVQRWLRRGYCSPVHIHRFRGLLPKGMTLDDLRRDREVVMAARAAEAC